VDLIDRFIEEEYLRFPVAARDDFLDMMSRLADPELQPKIGAPRRTPLPFVVREFQQRDRGAGY
jgi:hypothetical protein